MMSDPKFQAEMKRYTSSPQYKTAMSRASEDIEVLYYSRAHNLLLHIISTTYSLISQNLSRDPARLKKLEVDLAEKMRM